MRVSTKMIDEKAKDDHKHCLCHCDRLSTQGGWGNGRGRSGSWHMPSVSMVVRTDENDEQCQIQEQNQDECGLRKDQWMLIYRKSVVASRVMVADVRL